MSAGFNTGLSIGLGVCETCRVPGARYCPPLPDLVWVSGIWLCDSCQDPRRVRLRMDRERTSYARELKASI